MCFRCLLVSLPLFLTRNNLFLSRTTSFITKLSYLPPYRFPVPVRIVSSFVRVPQFLYIVKSLSLSSSPVLDCAVLSLLFSQVRLRSQPRLFTSGAPKVFKHLHLLELHQLPVRSTVLGAPVRCSYLQVLPVWYKCSCISVLQSPPLHCCY